MSNASLYAALLSTGFIYVAFWLETLRDALTAKTWKARLFNVGALIGAPVCAYTMIAAAWPTP